MNTRTLKGLIGYKETHHGENEEFQEMVGLVEMGENPPEMG